MDEFKADLYDYDFQAIYDTIKEHYPIEEDHHHYTRETLKTFAGYKKIERLVGENFFDKKNYKTRWTDFQKFLKQSIDKKIDNTHTLANTCFSGNVTVDELITREYVKTKALRYFISVLGPYYSIYAVDHSEVKLPTKMSAYRNEETRIISYHADHVATVSPVFEYESSFVQLQTRIKERFPTYKFIPYEIGVSTIDGISVYSNVFGGDEDAHKDSIYRGLFGPLVAPKCALRGDKKYGFSEWLKPLSKAESEGLELLRQHIAQTASPSMQKQASIHKVWKIKHWKLLQVMHNPGGGLFGVSLTDIMDLTDPEKIICPAGIRNAPEISSYKMDGENLIFNEKLSYNILEVSPDELKVVMHVNIDAGPRSIRGALCELTYEPLTEWKDPQAIWTSMHRLDKPTE
ncbi:hypothetical protein [Chryseolinea soli]|uniref:Uncharacterized protein n=1 Tax=Chryseolinea soli TaxID=2321403 RepID=A0A385SKP9_9BACT|nr:hypothetical protein [Chryseolinea soli]AYB30931.1 hypothetical protein D4L85_10230 [Chryseolinea soli]